VAVTDKGNAMFREAKIDDPAGHFKGTTIRVTGKVILKDRQPQIEVDVSLRSTHPTHPPN
jgi:hypothetical protein